MTADELPNPDVPQAGTDQLRTSTNTARHPGARIERGVRIERSAWRQVVRRWRRHVPSNRAADRAGEGERGSSVVEFVIVAPALMLMVALIVAGGRLALAQQAVEASAAQAARTASIARTHADATTTAHAAAQASLHAQGTRCLRVTVTLDTTGFATAVGTPATVGASVTCRVDLAGLLPQLPGAIEVTATADSPLDTYRER